MASRIIGKPFFPWQQYVADVLGEVDPRTGFRVYREGVITLMRQQGKTTYLIVSKAHRAIDCTSPQTILFAAQDGVESKKKWLDHANLLKASPFGERIPADQPRTTTGHEILTWSNGSTERPISSRPSSGHGETLDMGVVTEAFAQRDDRYEQTMKPATLNVPGAQFLVESTAGTAEALYWNDKVKLLREQHEVEPDRPSRIAFFDWSFDAADDPGAEETWFRRIPTLGLPGGSILENVQAEWDAADTPAKVRAFKRALGNITDLGAAMDEGAFPVDDWDATASDAWQIRGARAFALDVTNDRSWASIGQVGPNEAGQPQLELVAHDRTAAWVIPALVSLFERNPKAPRRVYVVAGGQAALMEKDIAKKNIEVVVLSRADYAAGCSKVFDEVTERALAHRETHQAPLDAAVAGAAWSNGDARVWDRLKSTSIIAPLVAVTAARWGYELEQSKVVDLMKTFA